MKIDLTEKWKIESDAYSWVLTFYEPRQKKDKKTDELKDYLFEDKWYFPTIRQCLRKFIDEFCKDNHSIEELLNKLDIISEKIEEIKNDTFKVK